jgi:hypothetical protein
LTETKELRDWVFNEEMYYDEDMLNPRMWESDEDYD